MFRWLKSLFGRPKPASPSVRYLDIDTKQVVSIPAAELRPGCVQARVQGIEEIVWIDPAKVQAGEIRHPPFEEDIREYIREIQTAFAEHRDLSWEEWEEGFRRDANAEREIAGFYYAASV